MQSYFEIVYGARIKHQPSYPFSRQPTNGSDHTTLEDDFRITAFTQSNKKVLYCPGDDAAGGTQAEVSSTFENSTPALRKFITHNERKLTATRLPNIQAYRTPFHI